jgi:hypothetical protein
MISITLSLIALAGVCWLAWLVRTAPVGWQDSSGWHLGERTAVCRRICAWCGMELAPAEVHESDPAAGKVSHCICATCKTEMDLGIW